MLRLPIIWSACYDADDNNKNTVRQAMRDFLRILVVCALFIAQPLIASDIVETRVFLNESCVIADEPVVVDDYEAGKGLFSAGIVSTVAQTMISSVVRSLAGGIRSSGRGKNHVYEAEQDIYLYQADFAKSPNAELNTQLACVTIVSGYFDGENDACAAEYKPATLSMSEASAGAINELRARRSAANVLRRANICLKKEPHYVFETRMELADDRSAFRMNSVGYEISRLQSARSDTDSRSLTSTYSFLEPSANGTGRVVANTWLKYGKVSPGIKVSSVEDSKRSGWTRLPALSGSVGKAYLADSGPYRALEKKMKELETDILRGVREQSALFAQAELENEAVAADLRRTASRLDTQIATQTAKLNALRTELDEMPKFSRDYMLVKFRVSVTESRSEEAMKLWLAEMIEANSWSISRGVTQLIENNE